MENNRVLFISDYTHRSSIEYIIIAVSSLFRKSNIIYLHSSLSTRYLITVNIICIRIKLCKKKKKNWVLLLLLLIITYYFHNL